MSKNDFSDAELAFFDEGDTLSDAITNDFSDLDTNSSERASSWVGRALAALSLVGSQE